MIVHLTFNHTDPEAGDHVWYLSVTAVDDQDQPVKLLVFHRTTDDTPDYFAAIASTLNMVEYPEDAAQANQPLYRIHQADIPTRSPKHLLELRDKIEEAVQDLVDNTNALANLPVAQTVEIT